MNKYFGKNRVQQAKLDKAFENNDTAYLFEYATKLLEETLLDLSITKGLISQKELSQASLKLTFCEKKLNDFCIDARIMRNHLPLNE